MDKKGDKIDVLFEKARGGDIELLEGLSQQTAVESLLANNRKFIPTRKKRGGCTGAGGETRRCQAMHHCKGRGKCRLTLDHKGDHVCEADGTTF
jgi:hypothetical protein